MRERTWVIQTAIFADPDEFVLIPPAVALLIERIDEWLTIPGGIEAGLNDDLVRAIILSVKLKGFFTVSTNVVQPAADNDVDAI